MKEAMKVLCVLHKDLKSLPLTPGFLLLRPVTGKSDEAS